VIGVRTAEEYTDVYRTGSPSILCELQWHGGAFNLERSIAAV